VKVSVRAYLRDLLPLNWRLLVVLVELATTFWVLESVLHALADGTPGLWTELLPEDRDEWGERGLVVFLLAVGWFATQTESNRRSRNSRRLADQAIWLRESEERYARSIDGSRDAIWDHDLQTNLIERSPRWYEMLGYEVGEKSELESNRELIHPKDRTAVGGR
jgi:PAS domain-containing protein